MENGETKNGVKVTVLYKATGEEKTIDSDAALVFNLVYKEKNCVVMLSGDVNAEMMSRGIMSFFMNPEAPEAIKSAGYALYVKMTNDAAFRKRAFEYALDKIQEIRHGTREELDG